MFELLIKRIFTRVFKGAVYSLEVLTSAAMHIVFILLFALALHFVPAWIIIGLIIAFLATIIYFTYKEELKKFEEEDDE